MGKDGPPITSKLLQNLYRNDRTGRVSFVDTATLKRSVKVLCKADLQSASEFKHDWLKGISNDCLRIELKKSFIKC